MKIIVNTSTFKQNSTDPSPSFINDLINEFSKSLEIFVLFPRKTKKLVSKNSNSNITLIPYSYFVPRIFSNISEIGILPSLKKNKLNVIKVLLLLLSQFLKLTYYSLKIKPDYIYSHWVFPQAFIGALVCKILNINHVFTSHGSDVSILNNLGYLGKSIKKFTIENSKKYTTVSSLATKKLNKNISFNKTKHLNIPMGINEIFFKNKSNLNKKSENLNLLYFGRITKYKGLDLVINACYLLQKNGHKFCLKIIGNGEYKNEIIKKAKKLNIIQNIKFIDFESRKNLIAHIDDASVIVIPSIETKYEFEAGPLSFLEGMARKKICLVSSSVGFVEYCSKDNSIIFESGNSDDLFKKLIQINDLSIEETAKLKENAFITAQKFTYKNISKKIENFLFSV